MKAARSAQLSQVSDWPAPQTLRHLLQRDELIKPPDDEFSADLGGLWLHLDDLEQHLEVHVRGQVVVAEPVEPGLIWGRVARVIDESYDLVKEIVSLFGYP